MQSGTLEDKQAADLIHVELWTSCVLLILPSVSWRRFQRIFGGFVWELGPIAEKLDSGSGPSSSRLALMRLSCQLPPMQLVVSIPVGLVAILWALFDHCD